jgi:8-oxo-dGTP diphosphatase
MARTVRAAGGVVWRLVDELLFVLVVHRPGYDDWSLPKGKIDLVDPDDEHAALREVREETGWRCSLGRELPSVHYIDRKGRPKVVRYWEMRPLADEGFSPNGEIDAVRWVDLDLAHHLLTYDTDRDVLAAFASFAGHAPRA